VQAFSALSAETHVPSIYNDNKSGFSSVTNNAQTSAILYASWRDMSTAGEDMVDILMCRVLQLAFDQV
jgi:hypothetical protein